MLSKSFYLPQCKLLHCKLHYLVFLFSGLFFLTPSYAQKKMIQKQSAFTARLVSLESTADKPFRYSASLHNGSGESRIFDLVALAPEGWISTFKVQGSEVPSVRIDSAQTQEISLELNPSPTVKPGKYTIPVVAVSPGDTLRLELNAVVKGNYDVELTTPTGRLSDDVTEGTSKVIQLTVVNTGSLPLDGLQLSAEAPLKWTATFEPSKLERLEPGKTQDVKATLTVPDKTIAGDYVTKFTVRNNSANADATFRMTVTTSLLSGWIGILIILLALGIVYYLIRKYGRR
jgi:uncharacterized membrane protein